MRFNYKLVTLIALLTLFPFQITFGQNLESIGTRKPLKVTGGISVNQMFYEATGSQSPRMPYTYVLAGNINFDLYEWSIPLSYTYSNQQSAFQQPFNQFGLHPKYKWITGHFGYASMTFSPYTLSGYQFLGGGVDLAPGSIFKFSAMGGRLQKAIELDSTNIYRQPAYKRMAMGAKTGVTFDKMQFEVMAFSSQDQINSLHQPLDSLMIFPEKNLALGFNTNVSLIEKVSLFFEYGASFITRDTRSPLVSDNLLFPKRTSSDEFNAYKAALKYTQTFYSLGCTYERIDPGYRTHGAYYFNNDLENITANATTSLLNKKLTLGVDIGVQRDDLDKKKMSKMTRVVSSINVGYVPNEKLNISLNYSTFNSHTNIKSQFQTINQLTPYSTLDTLNYTQLSQNSNLNVNYNLANSTTNRQNLSLNTSFQKATETQNQVSVNGGSMFLSMNMSHNYTFVKSNTTIVTSINYSNNNSADYTTSTIGPTVAIRKGFLKNRLKGSFTTSYNNSYSNSELVNSALVFRLTGGYVYKKKHNFNLTGANVNRVAYAGNVSTKFNEYTATLGYSYSF